MSKAADAFRTIAEVADELDVAKHVLRFWENKFPHIKPMKRGGGRRYYRPEDMELLRGVRHLLHAEGYTIKGVQKILREQGVDGVKRYGREAPPPAVAEQAPRKRAAALRQADAAARPNAAAAASAPKGNAETPNEILGKAIAELEACRVLLGAPDRAAAPATRSPVRRAR